MIDFEKDPLAAPLEQQQHPNRPENQPDAGKEIGNFEEEFDECPACGWAPGDGPEPQQTPPGTRQRLMRKYDADALDESGGPPPGE